MNGSIDPFLLPAGHDWAVYTTTPTYILILKKGTYVLKKSKIQVLWVPIYDKRNK